jgi:hypothetical protein
VLRVSFLCRAPGQQEPERKSGPGGLTQEVERASGKGFFHTTTACAGQKGCGHDTCSASKRSAKLLGWSSTSTLVTPERRVCEQMGLRVVKNSKCCKTPHPIDACGALEKVRLNIAPVTTTSCAGSTSRRKARIDATRVRGPAHLMGGMDTSALGLRCGEPST